MHFVEWKVLNCVPNFSAEGQIDNESALVDNVLVPTIRQAITRTNVDQVMRRHMASLSHNQLIVSWDKT